MTLALRVGMGDSYGVRCTVASSTDFAPATVTAAVLHVTKPEGDLITWTGVLSAQSSTSVTATYTLNADGSDLDQDGTWRVWVQWTVVGQTPGPRSEVGSFAVIAADQL